MQLYVALGVVSFVLAILAQTMRADDFTFMVSDARGYYAYLPSAVIDRDFDLKNQLARRDSLEGAYEGTTPLGLVNNPYPIGVSLTLAPAFLVAHAATTAVFDLTGLKSFQPDGYNLVYQLLVVAFVITLAVLTMTIVDTLAIQHLGIDPRAIGFAAALYWLGTSYFYYVFRQPAMAHIIGAFWVTCAVASFEIARTQWRNDASARIACAALGLSAGMAVITRPTNAGVLVFALYLVWAGLLRRNTKRRVEVLLLAVGLLPLFAQMWVWHRMAGSYLYYSYQGETFDWAHPKLLQTLFSSRHGLFFWSPLLVLAVMGLFYRKATQAMVIRLGLVALASLWIANSAWDMWWFGGSFGARAFLDLSVFFILGLAIYVEDRYRAGARAFTDTALVATACVGYSWVLMAMFMFKLISIDDYLLPWF